MGLWLGISFASLATDATRSITASREGFYIPFVEESSS